MRPYANSLEEWDDRVGDNWEEPESEYLNPQEWISKNEWFEKKEEYLEEILTSGFDKAERFMTKFHDVLSVYW